jgi:hypothetical protein
MNRSTRFCGEIPHDDIERWGQETMETVIAAVTYGIPLVLMDLTMKRMTNVARASGMSAPVNQFAHAPVAPSAKFRNVVRANVDTLYSSAFLDLSAGPLVLSVPNTGGRYYLMPMMDAWTNVFATPGARTTGTEARNFAITGPGWAGSLPPDMQQLACPTNMAWILGRTQTNGPEDYAAVHAVQAGYKLVSLSGFGVDAMAPEGVVDAGADMRTPPVDELQNMSIRDFLAALARLLALNPGPEADAPMRATLAGIGMTPGETFDPGKLDPAMAARPVRTALDGLRRKATGMQTSVNGWRIPRMNIGAFGADYDTRALIALMALGANLPADALYPTVFVDGDGQPLDGAHRYVLRFENFMTPPVNAFWSVTMYDKDSFFVDNPLGRYAICSWMPLELNGDGALEIAIQCDSPGADREPNWLPADKGAFNITMRMYWPKDGRPSILDGSWKPPPLIRVA